MSKSNKDGLLIPQNLLKALANSPIDRRLFMKIAGVSGATAAAGSVGFNCGNFPGASSVAANIDSRERELVLLAIDETKSAGAVYSDARISRHWSETVRTREQKVTGVNNSDSYGIGVRALVGGSWGFSATNKLDRESVMATAREAVAIAKANNKIAPSQVVLAPVAPVSEGYWETPHEIDPFDVPVNDKAELLLKTNANAQIDGVRFVSSSISSRKEDRLLATSDGTLIQQKLVRIYPNINITAISSDGRDFQTRGFVAQPMGLGWEYVLGLDFPGNAPKWGEEAVMKLSAKSVDPGQWDLVLHPSNLWLTIHENIGHPTELDRALGYEANFAGTSFIAPPEKVLNKLKLGPEFMTFIGNKNEVGGGATVGWDDEGVPASEWPIIKDGIFVDYQTTREQAAWISEYTGITKSHGCSFGQTWASIPFQRMPNVSLMPGEQDLSQDDVIAATDHGIMVEGRGSSSIDQQRYNFQFSGQVFWEIKNGKKHQMLRDVAYVGRTPDFWNSLGVIGGKQTYEIGTTFGDGKGQPGQSNSVSHGCPMSLFRNIKILNTA